MRVFVCLGNPPYDREQRDLEGEDGRRKGGWVRHGDEGSDEPPVLDDFLKPVRDAGGGVHLKNLYNDYVYFWRWALWKVFDSTEDAGIVTFITALVVSARPRRLPGMRRKMREVFDELWIIDLEGDSHRHPQDGERVRYPHPRRYRRRCPRRDRRSRSTPRESGRSGSPALNRRARAARSGKEAFAATRLAGMLARLGTRRSIRQSMADTPPCRLVTAVFPWQHSGAQLKRTWPIGETRAVLAARWRSLIERFGRRPPHRVPGDP